MMCNKRGKCIAGLMRSSALVSCPAAFMLQALLCTAAVLLFLSSCRPNVNYIKRVQSLEEGVGNPQTEAEIEEAIQKYQRRVEDIMAADNQTGIWYKILGVRYLDNRMYDKALEAFKNAVKYHPDNQNLYYYIGLCAGYMANAELDFPGTGAEKRRNTYLALAESAYLRALELEPRYVRSLYGLSVLYVFEMNKAAQAIPLLERLLTIDTKHTDAMFVLARAYYMSYDYEAASSMYDRILKSTKNEAKRAEAEANKKAVLDALYTGK